MTRRPRFDPETEEEIADAVDWYEAREPGLGAGLLAEIADAVREACAQPDAGLLVSRNPVVRRRLLRRFPYAVVYTTLPDELRVLAVAHHKRHPAYWKHRVRRRD